MHAAESAFTHVLSLDGENVIALKALADITERLAPARRIGALAAHAASRSTAATTRRAIQLDRVQASRRQARMASSASSRRRSAVATDRRREQSPAATVESRPSNGSRPRPYESELPPRRRRRLPPRSPISDLPLEPAMGWVSDSDAPSSEEAVPLAFEDLRARAGVGRRDEPVEPLGIVGMTETRRTRGAVQRPDRETSTSR